MAHIDTQQNSNLCLHLQALETRKVDDSIEALGNYISYLIPSFRRSTVSSGNVKKIEKSCIPKRSGRSAKAWNKIK